MVQRTYGLVRENTRLTAHLEEEVEKQTRQISSLVDERQKLLSEFLHDLKSPVSSLMTYTNLIRKNSIMLNEATEEQLRIIEEKSRDVSQQITLMQEFKAENPMKSNYQILDLNEFLETFYQMCIRDSAGMKTVEIAQIVHDRIQEEINRNIR